MQLFVAFTFISEHIESAFHLPCYHNYFPSLSLPRCTQRHISCRSLLTAAALQNHDCCHSHLSEQS